MTRFLGPWAGHLTILAFPGGGQFDRCHARGPVVEFEPENEMAMSLQRDWNETSSSTRGCSNVASCAMVDDQISVSGKYLSSICVIVVHPLSILISEDIFAYNDLYFIVLSLFRFPLWVICSFC